MSLMLGQTYLTHLQTLTKGDDNVKVKAVLSLRVTDPLIAINKFKKPEETITALETNTLHNSLITYTTEDILLKRQEVLDDLKVSQNTIVY